MSTVRIWLDAEEVQPRIGHAKSIGIKATDQEADGEKLIVSFELPKSEVKR